MARSPKVPKAAKAFMLAIALSAIDVKAASAQSPAAQSFRELLDRSERSARG